MYISFIFYNKEYTNAVISKTQMSRHFKIGTFFAVKIHDSRKSNVDPEIDRTTRKIDSKIFDRTLFKK